MFLLKAILTSNISNSKMDTNNYLSDFINTFSLTNIVNCKTCFKTLNGTLLDIMLRKKPKSFRKTYTIETGLSYCHKMMILLFLRAS